MKVKLLVSLSGTRDGEPWPERGSVVDLPDDEAVQMINGGVAAAPGADALETADAPDAESATVKRRKS